MGLLDDAIREHLELKRRRGADPALVAREERNALGTTPGGEPQDEDKQRDALGEPPVVETHEGVENSVMHTLEVDDRQVRGSQSGGQETAELDMRSVLHEEPEEPIKAVRAPVVDAVTHIPSPAVVGLDESNVEESLDREPPTAAGLRDPHSQVPNECLSESDELEDDLLEETPDFLRDTPDQDRLWFEQRPPRDFDFDK